MAMEAKSVSTYFLAGFTGVLAAFMFLITRSDSVGVQVYGDFASFALIGVGAWTWSAADALADKERRK